MKVDIQHSIVQDMSIVKFFSLSDYRKCIQFLQSNNLQWTPLKYSSVNDTASIRVSEDVLLKMTKRYKVGKNASTNTNSWTTRMRQNDLG